MAFQLPNPPCPKLPFRIQDQELPSLTLHINGSFPHLFFDNFSRINHPRQHPHHSYAAKEVLEAGTMWNRVRIAHVSPLRIHSPYVNPSSLLPKVPCSISTIKQHRTMMRCQKSLSDRQIPLQMQPTAPPPPPKAAAASKPFYPSDRSTPPASSGRRRTHRPR